LVRSYRAVQLGDGPEQLAAMAQQHAQLLEIALVKQGQGVELHAILGKHRRVALQPQALQPRR
jgi:hypothetical protein